MIKMLTPLFICVLGLSACNKPQAPDATAAGGPTYFSIKDFTRDQWKTFHGQPLLLTQYTTLNGKTDSSNISALDLKWSKIFKVFFETDISDPKFLEQYDFQVVDDGFTQTRTFTYEARDPQLFTQRLQIATDKVNNKIRNIFIETHKETFWNTRMQKLMYSPLHVLMIHETNDPLIGGKKDLNIEYHFM